jgi:hypothetical protein
VEFPLIELLAEDQLEKTDAERDQEYTRALPEHKVKAVLLIVIFLFLLTDSLMFGQ